MAEVEAGTDVLIRDVTDASFETEVLRENKPVVVKIWAKWCGPCKAIASMVNELALAWRENAKFVMVDADQNPKILAKYNVRGIPTFLFIRDGELQHTIVGYTPREALDRALDELVYPRKK